jgi:hypothetical protein
MREQILRDLLGRKPKEEEKIFCGANLAFDIVVMDLAYGVVLPEKVNSVLANLERHAGIHCHLHVVHLLAVARICQHIDQVAVVGRVDVESEEEHPSEENPNRPLRGPVMTVLSC